MESSHWGGRTKIMPKLDRSVAAFVAGINPGHLSPNGSLLPEWTASKVRPVHEYRLFFFDGNGRLNRAPHEFFAQDDKEALSIAEAWREGRKMELWQRGRRLRCWGFPD